MTTPGAGEAVGSPPSLIVRLSLTAVIVVLLSMGLIGLAVDRAFLSAERAAQRERLEAAVFAVLSGLEVGPDGTFDWTGAPAESLLTQPESGLYAGVVGAHDSWLSPSTLGLERVPRPPGMSRGESRWVAGPGDSAEAPRLYARGLGWELNDGRILDITVWAGEDPDRLAGNMASFRGDLWRWLGMAAVVLVAAQLILLAQPLAVLRKVAREVRSVESGARTQLGADYPRELRPLTENLNALLATERANAERWSQALADLAHSLKTPLAVLNSELDRERAPEAGELRETVAQMQARIRHELERARRSARRTMLAAVDVAPIARRTVRSLERLYPRTRFELDCSSQLKASVEARDLMEILGNLLENAAKYAAGRVRVSLAPHHSGARRAGLQIRVDDNGPGLDPQKFAELLGRGVRGDERAEGQGLGLAIVQRIVESYHGAIRADRSPLGGLRVEAQLRPG